MINRWPVLTALIDLKALLLSENQANSRERDGEFESGLLQRRVGRPSVPQRPSPSLRTAQLPPRRKNGWGVPKNYAKAMRWYRMAADQGNAFGQGSADLG